MLHLMANPAQQSSLSIENVMDITMLNKNMKPIVYSPDGNIDFFDIDSGVL